MRKMGLFACLSFIFEFLPENEDKRSNASLDKTVKCAILLCFPNLEGPIVQLLILVVPSLYFVNVGLKQTKKSLMLLNYVFSMFLLVIVFKQLRSSSIKGRIYERQFSVFL